jgi:hypothetical protein
MLAPQVHLQCHAEWHALVYMRPAGRYHECSSTLAVGTSTCLGQALHALCAVVVHACSAVLFQTHE